MVDREKVIKGLECCTNNGVVCFSDCPYCKEFTMADGRCITALQADALALLKEQEPIAPSVCGSKEPDGHGCWWYLCGKCKKPIDHKDKFCKRCGQAVKWE